MLLFELSYTYVCMIVYVCLLRVTISYTYMLYPRCNASQSTHKYSDCCVHDHWMSTYSNYTIYTLELPTEEFLLLYIIIECQHTISYTNYTLAQVMRNCLFYFIWSLNDNRLYLHNQYTRTSYGELFSTLYFGVDRYLKTQSEITSYKQTKSHELILNNIFQNLC